MTQVFLPTKNVCEICVTYHINTLLSRKKKKIKCHIISAEIISNNEAEFEWAERKR